MKLVVGNGAGVVLAFGEDNARMLGYAPYDGATVPSPQGGFKSV